MNRVFALVILSVLLLSSVVPDAAAQGTGRGSVEQKRVEPLAQKLDAEQNRSNLKLIEQKPTLAPEDEPSAAPPVSPRPSTAKIAPLIGNIGEENLMIEWNDWHNRFARTVRQRVFPSFIQTLNMRPGSKVFYRCVVTADKQIKDVKIIKSSGDFWYDSAVIKAVNALDGNNILSFPSQSKRTEIATEVGIELGGKRRDEMDFGDVEYRELAPGEKPPANAAETAK